MPHSVSKMSDLSNGTKADQKSNHLQAPSRTFSTCLGGEHLPCAVFMTKTSELITHLLRMWISLFFFPGVLLESECISVLISRTCKVVFILGLERVRFPPDVLFYAA